MQDLVEIKRRIEHVEYARGGTVPADRVLDEIIAPLLRLTEARKEKRWIDLKSAMLRSRRTESYFRAPQKRYGGRSRLQVWQENGDAEQVGTGRTSAWLINPDVLLLSAPTGVAPQQNPDSRAAATALLNRHGIKVKN